MTTKNEDVVTVEMAEGPVESIQLPEPFWDVAHTAQVIIRGRESRPARIIHRFITADGRNTGRAGGVPGCMPSSWFWPLNTPIACARDCRRHLAVSIPNTSQSAINRTVLEMEEPLPYL